MSASAPWLMATIAMTAATPNTMPSMVRMERNPLRRSDRHATRSVMPNTMIALLAVGLGLESCYRTAWQDED